MKGYLIPCMAMGFLLWNAAAQDATVLEVENVVQAAKGGQAG